MIDKIEEITIEDFPDVCFDWGNSLDSTGENLEFIMDQHNALVRKFNELAEVVNKLSSTGDN